MIHRTSVLLKVKMNSSSEDQQRLREIRKRRLPMISLRRGSSKPIM